MFLLFSLLSCRSDDGVKAYNSNPLVTITSHTNGTEVLEGAVETCTAQISDPNHDTSSLVIQWMHNDSIACDWSSADDSGQSSCEIPITINTSKIIAQVNDPEGAAGTASLELSVTPTEAPQAYILHPISSGIHYSDQKVTFEGTVSDQEDEEENLTVSWHSDIDGDLGIAEEPSNTGSVIGYGYLSEGEHAIELHVEDSTGKTDIDSVLIHVGPPNSAPTCTIVSPINGTSVAQGSFVTFEGMVEDVDVSASLLSVSWSSDKDGDLGSSTPNSDGSVLFAYSDLSIDVHAITLTATDEIGETCTHNMLLTVGTPPSISITAPTNGGTYAQGDPLLFSAQVLDDQDTAGDIDMLWELNGATFSTQGATSTGISQFTDATLPAGTHTLKVTATDSSALNSDDLISFHINGLPSAPNVTLTPNLAYTTDNLTAQASGSVDPEGGTITYSYAWLKNGVIQSNTNAILSSSNTQKGELWLVRVTPNDGISAGSSGEALIVIANTAPQIHNVSISPSNSVYNDTVLTCSANATDPDEPLTPIYEWSIDGSIIASGSSLDLSAYSANSSSNISCIASVTDGDGESDTRSDTITLENRLSEVSTLSLSPSILYTNDTATANATFFDPDGQTVTATYEWHVIDAATGSDGIVQNGSINTLEGQLHVQKHDQIYVVVTPNDGVENGVVRTSSIITISNTLPTTPNISISPISPDVHDDLTCSIDIPSYDDDGDVLTYTYQWNDPMGSPQQSTSSSGTSDILSSSLSSEGNWTCTVTTNDGEDDGAAATATSTVDGGCASLSFDGVDDRVHLGDSENMLSLQSDFSVCVWTYLDALPPTTTYGIVDLEATRSSNPAYNSGIAIEVEPDGRIRGHYGTGTFPNEEVAYANTPLNINQWYHICVTRTQSDVSIYINGLLDSTSTLYADPLIFDGAAYETDVYQLGLYSRNGAAHSYTDGMIRDVGVWDTVLHSSEITALRDQGISGVSNSGLVGYWPLDEGSGSIANDVSTGGNHGTIEGAIWMDGCPGEDLDLDGIPGWQDCDDTDPSIYYKDGSSSTCPAQSCLQILDEGYNQGSGTYWIDPLESGAFQVYCDMDGDDGGWTLVANISATNQNHWGGTAANNIQSITYPIPFESNQAGRRMSDAHVHSIASNHVFRVEASQNQAREGDSDFIYRTFFRYSTPNEFSFNARGGANSPLIWTSHAYPFVWEEDGGGDGYHFGCNDYDYAVFDSHNENCPNVWVSSEYYTRRILFGHSPVNGILSEHLGEQSGYMWVR